MRNEKGFTLIELMVVLVILGLLVGIVVPRVLDLRDDALKGTAKANLRTLRTELDLYYLEKGNYPTSVDNMDGSLEKVWEEIDNHDNMNIFYVNADYTVRLEIEGEHIILTPDGLGEWQS
jgi:type II secretion system protein G